MALGMTIFARAAVPLVILGGIGYWAWSLSLDGSQRALVFSLLNGAVFGIILQRSRFCFFCNFRDFAEQREPRGLLAIVVALAVGAVLYHVVIMAWVPMPQPGALPPNAHIAPVGPALAVAAFAFGLGMAISGSCLSAHLYRLGEGSPTAPFALLGAAGGFYLGFLTWNPIYLASISETPAVWLPHSVGYAGTLAITGLLCLAALLVLLGSRRSIVPERQIYNRADLLLAIFVKRWPPLISGTAIGIVSAAYFFRVTPLGVTAELGSIVRTVSHRQGLLPDTLHGLDALRGCVSAVKETVFSANGLLVSGLILGSFASAFAAGQFKPSVPTIAQMARGLLGGLLLGWGAMTGLGCTIGTLLSGIHAGALSGWVFLVFCVLGTWIGIRLTALFSYRSARSADA